MKIILASASPRRAELLQQIGIDFVQQSADIDETPFKNEPPTDYVLRMALSKAETALLKVKRDCGASLVLAADTSVVIQDEILGKPLDFEDFRQMMHKLSGKEHSVLTSLALANSKNTESLVSESKVLFRHLDDEQINWYWSTGEPQDKAGGYGIQGLGGQFVVSITGSYSGIVGLPLYETAQILSKFGIAPEAS